MQLKRRCRLTANVKLTDFGAAITDSGVLSKEDLKAIELAERAQKGDFDDGKIEMHFRGGWANHIRSHTGAIGPQSCFPYRRWLEEVAFGIRYSRWLRRSRIALHLGTGT
jgi:hypothetical protein